MVKKIFFDLKQYQEDGYLVLDGVVSSEDCNALRQRMGDIVDQMDVPEHCRIQFSTDHDEQLKTQVSLSHCVTDSSDCFHFLSFDPTLFVFSMPPHY